MVSDSAATLPRRQKGSGKAGGAGGGGGSSGGGGGSSGRPSGPGRRRGTRLSRALDWLDERSGYRAALGHALEEPVRGGASPVYVFGSVLVFVLINQMLTGALLAAFYAPSAQTAWASVAYLQDQVFLGWFIRGLHAAGASMMVVTTVLHLVQVTVYGAYRAPRELNWWTGLLLACMVMGFALTGYLLPWDQKGYWATQVATTLLGATPLIGPALQTLVQGGPSYGNLTLTHFYALHVFLLPAVVIGLVVLHVVLFRRHGVTPRWGRSDEELSRRTEPFWPRQLVYDLAAMAAALLLLFTWVLRTHGAELSAPADPSSAFDARPEWYFLPLYQLLKYFPGPLEVAVALGVPLLGLGALGALPMLDRASSTDPRRRKAPLSIAFGGLFCAVLLGVLARAEDAASPAFQKSAQAAERDAARARELARRGVLPEGGTAVYLNDPLEQGRLLFKEHCAGCHRLGSLGPAEEKDVKGPDLTGFSSRSWIEGFLRNPDGPSYFGRTPIHGMKAVHGEDQELKALTEYVYSLSGPRDVDAGRLAQGKQLFEDKNCDTCHELDGKTEGEGPSLAEHGAASWVRLVLLDPGSPMLYGDKNDMPSYGKKLSAEELDSVSAFVAAQRDRK